MKLHVLINKDTLELLVYAAYAHDEISIGRAREILHMKDADIKEQAKKRVSNAMKLKAERDALYWQVEQLMARVKATRQNTINEAVEALVALRKENRDSV